MLRSYHQEPGGDFNLIAQIDCKFNVTVATKRTYRRI